MRPGRVVVVGDADAVFGLGLVGLEGHAVSDVREAARTLEILLADPQVALVLLTEDHAEALRERVDRAAASEGGPLVVEIPASRPPVGRDSLHRRVERALGVRLEG